MGPMGFYTCKADGLRKEPEVYFDFVALIMLTSIYIYGVGKKGIKYATLYYLAAVLCVKIPFFFDNSSVSDFPTPLLLRSIRGNAKYYQLVSLFLPLAISFAVEYIILKPLIPIRKIFLIYQSASIVLYLVLLKLWLTQVE